jgi:chemotaxis protein MotB
MAADDKPIIIKKKKHGEHGHHGGAWKVAYADFVTAMMAFFLLMWLLNVTTKEQKLGIAQYFTPASTSNSQSGAGAILGGATLAPGQMARTAGGIVMGIPTAPAASEGQGEKDNGDAESPPYVETPAPVTEDDVKEAMAKREEEQFAKAEQDLREAIEAIPELQQMSQSLLIDNTPEGMRIQIVDQDRYAMFPSGSAALYDHTKKIIGLVAQVVQRMPNAIAVTGHTDATPFQRNNYSNWELSTDRANSSRRALLELGVPPARIKRVVGKADQDPLLVDDPTNPRNRRISIVLLREAAANGN